MAHLDVSGFFTGVLLPIGMHARKHRSNTWHKKAIDTDSLKFIHAVGSFHTVLSTLDNIEHQN